MRTTRYKLLRNSIGFGILAGLFGSKTSLTKHPSDEASTAGLLLSGRMSER